MNMTIAEQQIFHDGFIQGIVLLYNTHLLFVVLYAIVLVLFSLIGARLFYLKQYKKMLYSHSVCVVILCILLLVHTYSSVLVFL